MVYVMSQYRRFLVAGRRTMHYRITVFNAYAIYARVFFLHFNHGIVGFLACPITLIFQQHLLPGDRNCSSLYDVLNGCVMPFALGSDAG